MENLIFGSDIGNYSTEITSDMGIILQPSFINFVSTVFEKTEEKTDAALTNLLENLKVKYVSDENKLNGFYHIGNSAIRNGGEMARSMNIVSNKKSSNDIPIIMTGSLIAAQIVLTAYNNGEITDDLKDYTFEQNISLTTGIPASEFNVERAEALQKKFATTHEVTLYFGDSKAKVILNIYDCKVTEEGKTAMIYLSNLTDEDKKNAFKSFHSIKENKGRIVIFESTTYSLGVDIGNGTIEFTYFQGVNPIRSKGIDIGIGHAIESAIEAYSAKLDVKIDRQTFYEILKSNSRKSALAKECLDGALREISVRILEEIKAAVSGLTKGQLDYLLISGGGSILLRDNIFDSLLDYCETSMYDLLYIDEEFAASLNSRGCYELGKIIFGGK